MKSETRHDLQKTEIEKWTEAGSKFFESYGKYVVLGLVAIVGITVLGMWFFNRGNSTKEAATSQLMTATDTKGYLTVAENPDYGDIKTSHIARFLAAENQLDSALKLYFESTDAGKKALKAAQDNFKAAIDSDELRPDDKERALYKYAVVTEALSGRDTSKAIAAYKALLSEFPESRYKKIATDQIALLQTEDAKEFYAFLSTYKRKPGDLKKPGDHRNMFPHGGRDVFKEEKPVELPRVPNELMQDLDDKPKSDGPVLPKKKKKDSASPFPPAPKKDDGKKTGAKTKAGKFPAKTPAKKK